MIHQSDIKEHMEVLGSDGQHVGTVDHLPKVGSGEAHQERRAGRPASSVPGVMGRARRRARPPEQAEQGSQMRVADCRLAIGRQRGDRMRRPGHCAGPLLFGGKCSLLTTSVPSVRWKQPCRRLLSAPDCPRCAPRSSAPAARRIARSGERHAGRGVEDVWRRGDRAGDRRRSAGVRREPRAGGQGQMAAADARRYPGLELHMIGPLQSNKAKEAVALFDAIHSVDRPSLCEALAKEIAKQGRRPLLFVEINTGAEPQKAGVLPQDADAFLDALPRRLRAVDRRADVHSAARRSAGAAFRADRQDRRRATGSSCCRWA